MRVLRTIRDIFRAARVIRDLRERNARLIAIAKDNLDRATSRDEWREYAEKCERQYNALSLLFLKNKTVAEKRIAELEANVEFHESRE